MAEGIVQFLLEKMGTVLHEEYKHMKNLQKDVEYIQDELLSMCAFLRHAEAKQDAGLLDDEQKAWFKQVLKVSYHSEDVVDEFLLRFAKRNDAGFHGNVRQMHTAVKNLPYRRRISSKISDIKIRVQEISTRHQIYRSSEGITETSSNRSSEIPIRGHALLLSEANLVGIDRPRRDIISLILTDESHLKAISVWGMGGLGKTTLVKRVYEQVKGQFTIHAWMTISQTFAIDDALQNLIHQLFEEVNQPIPTNLDKKNADELRAVVKNFLTGKKYIIVLDDLWKLDHWYSINYVFPDDVFGSRIIITTRIEDVANMCCHEFNGNVHKMQPLSPDNSWQLFCKRTFKGGECPPNLKDISQNILNKCGGLPLGIVAIGSLLAIKDTREWEIVLRSLGGYLERNGNLNPVILLSYNDLPSHLKCCLLYMGMFPEDAAVGTEQLLHLWMAEGFVEVTQLTQGMTTIEVARSYLNDLIGRSLVHVVRTDTAGNIKECRVHDLTYEIIQSKCKEYNIFTRNSVQSGSVRRLVVVDDESNFAKEPANLLHLRSIITTSRTYDSSVSKLLRTSKLLKVLHLTSSPTNNTNIILDEVFRLSNLTYLNLSGTHVTNISKRIRHLQNLEYLSLVITGVTELPDDIVTLKKLYYLSIVPGFKAPCGFGALVSLHYLECIQADSENVIHEIGKLTQLRSLTITNVTRENGKALCSTLEKLTNLQNLEIRKSYYDELLTKSVLEEVRNLDEARAPASNEPLPDAPAAEEQISEEDVGEDEDEDGEDEDEEEEEDGEDEEESEEEEATEVEDGEDEESETTEVEAVEPQRKAVSVEPQRKGEAIQQQRKSEVEPQRKLVMALKAPNEIMDVDYSLDLKIPNWVPKCHSLTTLRLCRTCLSENPLVYLEGMPNLVDLRLIEAYTGDTLNFKEGGFQKLKFLRLEYLSELRFLRFEKGTLPEVERVEIHKCRWIEKIPRDTLHLKKVQVITLGRMPKNCTY